MESYRAHSSVVWGWIAVGIGATIALVHVATVGLTFAHGGLGLGTALIALGFATFIRPHVAVTADSIIIHNVTQTLTMPLSRLAALETRWTLEAIGDDGKRAGAFAAPAPGASQSRRIVIDARRAAAAGLNPTLERASDAEGTASGDAAAMVRRAWEAWRASQASTTRATTQPATAKSVFAKSATAQPASSVTQPTRASVTRRPDAVGIVLIATAIAAAVWGMFL